MASKRVHRRLKKALEEQKNLEDELNKLQDAQNPKEVCQKIIAYVQSGIEEGKTDPMATDDNPYKVKPSCFVEGTQITVCKDGTAMSIEDITVGDSVLSLDTDAHYDSDSYKSLTKHLTEAATVTAIYSVTVHDICRIKTRNLNNKSESEMSLTNGHPLYVLGEGWKTTSGTYNASHGYSFKVSKLGVGDKMCDSNGSLVEVTSIDTVHIEEGVSVYNMTVASQTHTYFANGVLTHNKCPCAIL